MKTYAKAEIVLALIELEQNKNMSFKTLNTLKQLAKTVIKPKDLKAISLDLFGVDYESEKLAKLLNY